MIISQVINDFLEIDGNNVELIKISEIKGSQIIKYISSYFIGTLKKVEYIPEKYHKHAGYFIRNMMNTVMRTIGLDVRYCNKLFNHFGKWFLSFQKFIDQYNLPEKYFKEYYYAAFSGLFILIFGKIKKFKLYDIIVRLWILMNNKDNFEFFIGGHFISSEKRLEFFEKNRDSPIIDCFKNIEKMGLSEKKKDGLYIRFYKLFMFSYKFDRGEGEGEGEGEFEILKNCCLKAKKALDIFFYAIDYQKKKKKEDAYKIFHVTLIFQLLDDLMDIRKDKGKGKTTIFTGEVDKNTRNAVRLFQLIQKSQIMSDYGFKIFYECLMFLIIDFNSEFFEAEFVRKIQGECSVMDLKYYNMRELDSIVESEIMKKIICIYLK